MRITPTRTRLKGPRSMPGSSYAMPRLPGKSLLSLLNFQALSKNFEQMLILRWSLMTKAWSVKSTVSIRSRDPLVLVRWSLVCCSISFYAVLLVRSAPGPGASHVRDGLAMPSCCDVQLLRCQLKKLNKNFKSQKTNRHWVRYYRRGERHL